MDILFIVVPHKILQTFGGHVYVSVNMYKYISRVISWKCIPRFKDICALNFF